MQTKVKFLFSFYLNPKCLFSGLRRIITLWFSNTSFLIENPCFSLSSLIFNTNQFQSQTSSSSIDPLSLFQFKFLPYLTIIYFAVYYISITINFSLIKHILILKRIKTDMLFASNFYVIRDSYITTIRISLKYSLFNMLFH